MNVETTTNATTPRTYGFQWVKDHITQLVGVAVWVMVIVATRQYMQANAITFGQLVQQLGQLLAGTWYGPFLYILIYLLRPLILFPASLLTILAGSIFGLWLGFFWGLIAGTLSAAFPYAVGRWFSNEDAGKEQEGNALQRFVSVLKRNPFQAVLTMRLLYLPYDAVSVLAGSLRIPFVQFASATAIGNIGGTFSFIGIGASLDISQIGTGQIAFNPATLVFSLVILVASLALSRYLSNRDPQDSIAA